MPGMNKHVPKLDIIIPHYNEPWSVGEKAFGMLAQQRLIDFRDVQIIIVQDGEDCNLDWKALLNGFPYPYQVITIPHGGVSAARNAGIRASTADYMMFCDFDDMFSDIWSLCLILKVLPTNSYDILWMPFTQERKIRNKYFSIAKFPENTIGIAGKIFRSSLIKDNDLWFDTRLSFFEDTVFYYNAVSATSAKRYGKISTEIMFPYCVTYRNDSVRHNASRDTYIRKMQDLCMRGQYLIETLKAHKKKITPDIAVAVFEAYHIFNRQNLPEELIPYEEKFFRFYQENKLVYDSMDPVDTEFAFSSVRSLMNGITVDNNTDYGVEETPVDYSTPVNAWLASLEDKYSADPTPATPASNIVELHPAPIASSDKGKRLAVYTGTRNVYENMLVSAKSLIANSNVDKIYFLIEDDVFPYDLPDMIQTINVSGQEYFSESSPNYDTAWSYMCLLRAAFTKYFPDADRILSLDIDTVIVKDVSALWDLDMSDSYIAGVPETDDKRHGIYNEDGHSYVNFGVVMMNLNKLRQDKIDDTLIQTINTTKYAYPEQDPFNLFCDGHILYLDSAYNNTVFYHITDESPDPYIYHYAGITYYKHYTAYTTYLGMPWEDVLRHHPSISPVSPDIPSGDRIVVYAGNRNYYHMLSTAAKSLLYNTDVDRVYFLIEDDEFPEPLPSIIKTINVSHQPYINKTGPNIAPFYSPMTTMRAILSKLFPDLDRILWLDPDTVVLQPIDDIWTTDISSAYFAAVREVYNHNHTKDPYYNAGVMLVNLQKLRDGTDDKLIDVINNIHYEHLEQDALNFICDPDIIELPPRFGAAVFTEHVQNPIIYHCVNTSKDLFDQLIIPYQDLSWDQIISHRKGVNHHD